MAEGALLAVTGASGFIGRHFVREALRRGYRIRALVREPSAIDVPGIETRNFDLASTHDIDPGLLTECDAVIHLASRVPEDQTDPAEAELCWNTNALGTLRLVEAAIEAGTPAFLHTLSANAYAGNLDIADEAAPMFPAERATYYLSSKIAQELNAAFRARETSTAVAALRLSSVYGPGQVSGPIPAMAKRLLEGESIQLVNQGCFGADFVYVDDVIAAIFLALKAGFTGPLNVAGGRRRTMREVVDLLLRETGRSDALVEHVQHAGDTPGFPAIAIDRARKLGYKPLSLEQGIARMVEQLRAG